MREDLNTENITKQPEWYEFQEKICKHFKSLGADAKTNITVEGTRTNHDIDVLVKSQLLGQSVTWVIEAKFWNKKINKLHALALRTIVEDIGADKGFIISNKGFQSGAKESVKNSNISLITYDEFIQKTRKIIQLDILNSYRKRVYYLERKYFSHSKRIKEKYGLKSNILEYPVIYSCNSVRDVALYSIEKAKNNEYPIRLDTQMEDKRGTIEANSFEELIEWLNLNLNYMDEKILNAEILMIENNDFKPNYLEPELNEYQLELKEKIEKLNIEIWDIFMNSD